MFALVDNEIWICSLEIEVFALQENFSILKVIELRTQRGWRWLWFVRRFVRKLHAERKRNILIELLSFELNVWFHAVAIDAAFSVFYMLIGSDGMEFAAEVSALEEIVSNVNSPQLVNNMHTMKFQIWAFSLLRKQIDACFVHFFDFAICKSTIVESSTATPNLINFLLDRIDFWSMKNRKYFYFHVQHFFMIWNWNWHNTTAIVVVSRLHRVVRCVRLSNAILPSMWWDKCWCKIVVAFAMVNGVDVIIVIRRKWRRWW